MFHIFFSFFHFFSFFWVGFVFRSEVSLDLILSGLVSCEAGIDIWVYSFERSGELSV